MSELGLVVDLTARRGDFTLEVALEVDPGESLAVLGPNGSGKSTLLDAIAGVVQPSRGRVTWRGRDLSTATGRPVRISSRRIGLLRQDPLLFPHLTVAENVAFGRRAQRLTDPRGHAATWMDRLQIAGLADRRPRQLSGGQAARVAIARALAAEPEVLLLDEPLAALDAAAAPELRALLAEVLRAAGTTAVLVSHDVLDAALLADRIAVLHDGAIVEQGERAEVLEAPRTAFTAAFVGVNLAPVGYAALQAAHPTTGATQLRFRPAAVVVRRERDDAANAWEATVRWLEPATGGVRVRLTSPAHPDAPDVLADLDPATVDGDWLRPGATVWAHVPPSAITAI